MSDASEQWKRRKQHELLEMLDHLQRAADDRSAGRTTQSEDEMLEGLARKTGRALTASEANWSLAEYRRYRDW